MKIDSPCMGCKKRYVGCHSECLAYIDYKQRLAIQHELMDQERRFAEDQRERIRSAIKRVKGGHNKGGVYERPAKD